MIPAVQQPMTQTEQRVVVNHLHDRNSSAHGRETKLDQVSPSAHVNKIRLPFLENCHGDLPTLQMGAPLSQPFLLPGTRANGNADERMSTAIKRAGFGRSANDSYRMPSFAKNRGKQPGILRRTRFQMRLGKMRHDKD